jgi:hypothetical protein
MSGFVEPCCSLGGGKDDETGGTEEERRGRGEIMEGWAEGSTDCET